MRVLCLRPLGLGYDECFGVSLQGTSTGSGLAEVRRPAACGQHRTPSVPLEAPPRVRALSLSEASCCSGGPEHSATVRRPMSERIGA